ncbi:MAG: alpha/beta hydrolase family protein [Sandaracinaceae bacterium]
MTRRRALVGVALLGLLAALAFEAGARWLLRAPGATRPPITVPVPDGARGMQVSVGPPDATLDAWIFDPPGAPRATILAIHGVWDDKQSRVGLARYLAGRGARVVLVDLRGHGASTGAHLYFGAQEADDIVQVLDALERDGELVAPLGVHGSSYGGAVAHQLAGRDPRVTAVVTVAAFADMPGLMRAYADASWPGVAWAIPDVALRLLGWRAATIGGFTLEDTDVVPAVRRSTAEVLLFHGDADEVVPFEHAARIAEACRPRGCRLETLRGANHDRALHNRDVRRAAARFLRDELGLADRRL